MRTRLKRKIHVLAEKYFSEQRLYLRTDNSTRFLRLTPPTQMILTFAAALFFGWTIFVSSAFLIHSVDPSSSGDQTLALQIDYETRLNSLSGERDKRALEAQKAQERFYVALEQISAQQSALLASEDRRRELETGIGVIQRTLRKTMKERDRAEVQSDKLLGELQTVTGTISTEFGAAEDVSTTLDFLNAALAKTVQERDGMIVTTAEMNTKVEDLKHQAKLTKERNGRIFSRLEEAVTVSISPLEKMFENVGLSTDKLLNDVRAGYSGTGGPLTPLAISTKGQPMDPASLQANALLAELDKVNMMRIAAERLPFVLPVKSSYRATSGYGWRRHPTSGKGRMHDGIDLAASSGTPLYATADGVVKFVGWAGGYGRVIKIQHALGFETRYAHMLRFRVKKGQRVSRGDRIGDMGSSGRSTGSHVHYEVRIGGKSVNPMKYIKAARNVF
ncbi:MAG: murein DD-endopeptidase MepM/ murein hydrolase activator NlpD [Paracoccaceae bacterium]